LPSFRWDRLKSHQRGM